MKKYGLIWEDYPEETIENFEINKPYLWEVEERGIKQSSDELTHLLIEGDNYEVLRLLQDDLKDKVSVIYIDPPYNTKNTFVYTDNYKNHSKWLSFMHKRLVLAKELMSEDGVIFISIDDNEFAQLKLLCDEIFGEQNFVSSIIWQCKHTVSNDKKGITSQTEYVLVYSKTSSRIDFKNEPLREEYVLKNYKNPDNDPRGSWATVQLYKKKNPKTYTVTSPTGKEWNMPWNYNEEGFKRLIEDNMVFWGKDGNACPRKKVFLKDSKGVGQKNLWLGTEVGYSGDGGNLLEEILGDRNLFSYPKPIGLIKKIVDIVNNKNAVVLDFFAGSGTTGHAVLELNEEDGGNRQFILCTNNENKICEEVTYERLNKVINGYTTPKGKEVDGIPANLKYYKVKHCA